jgi:hypothetical protein
MARRRTIRFLIPEGAVMPSTKTPLRFYLLAAALWLSAAPAFGQDAPDVTLQLSPAQAREIMRLVDLQPMTPAPPPAFWELQVKLGAALEANPDAKAAFGSARK